MRRLPAPVATLLGLVLAWSAPAAALETPMVLDGGNLAVTIDPGLGLATVINVESNGTKRLGWRHFLSDLTRVEKTVIAQGTKTYSFLRLGTDGKTSMVTPSVEEFLRIFPDKPTKKDTELGRDAAQKRVRDAEDAFWDKLPPYDGKIAGAFNGTYLMLAVPSRHALLFYENASEKLELRGWYNYGPMLYVTTAWKSEPNPAKLAASLTLDDEQKKTLEGALAEQEGEVAQAAPSEVWAAASGKDFVLVDTANRLLMKVSFPGKKVSIDSVRSLSADLLIPGMATTPTDADGVAAFAKSRAALIKEAGLTVDVPYIKALVALSAAGDGAKAGHLQANVVNGMLLLNFTTSRKLLGYDLNGSGNGIELKTVRDTTYDAGLATLDRLFQERADARQAVKEAEKAAAKHSPAEALRLAAMALALDPEQVTQIEKSPGIRNELSKTAEWEPMLAAGAKAAEEAKAKRAAIEAAAQAERDKKKNPKK